IPPGIIDKPQRKDYLKISPRSDLRTSTLLIFVMVLSLLKTLDETLPYITSWIISSKFFSATAFLASSMIMALRFLLVFWLTRAPVTAIILRRRFSLSF